MTEHDLRDRFASEDRWLDRIATAVMVLALILVALLLATRCSHSPTPVPPPNPEPVPVVDAGGCMGAEERLRVHDCRLPDGTPRWQTAAGTAFSEVCEDALADGRDWQPDTIAVEACE